MRKSDTDLRDKFNAGDRRHPRQRHLGQDRGQVLRLRRLRQLSRQRRVAAGEAAASPLTRAEGASVLDLQGYGPSLPPGHGADHRGGAAVAGRRRGCSAPLGALAKTSRSPVAQGVAGVYTTLIRGVPDLVLMLLIFFGGQMLVNQIAEARRLRRLRRRQRRSPPACCTIGFIYGAYMTETFRGAILAVPPGQLEAGQAFGMSRWQVFRRDPAAADHPPRAARLRQQLAGPAQGHGPALGPRPRRHAAQGEPGRRRHPPAVHLLPCGRPDLPAAHDASRPCC